MRNNNNKRNIKLELRMRGVMLIGRLEIVSLAAAVVVVVVGRIRITMIRRLSLRIDIGDSPAV